MYALIILLIFYLNLLIFKFFCSCFCLGADVVARASSAPPPLLAICSRTLVNTIQQVKEESRQIVLGIAHLEQVKQEQAKMFHEIEHLKESNQNEIVRSLELLQRFKPSKRKLKIPQQEQQHPQSSVKLKAVFKGIQGGIFVSYGKQWGRVYLGLEATYLLSNEKANLGGLGFHKKNTTEVTIRSGFALGHALFYGKLSFLNSQFQLVGKPLYFKGTSWGLGADIKILPRVLLGFGYAYDVYEKKQSIDTNGSFLNLKPTSHRVMLRVGYKT